MLCYSASMIQIFNIIANIIASLGISEIVDITIVAVLIYLVIIFIKETRSFFIFSTTTILLGIVYISEFFGLSLTQKFFQPFLTFFLLIIVIVFQKEIRRFFLWFSIPRGGLQKFRQNKNSDGFVQKIFQAVMIMAKQHMGAIVVIAGMQPVEHSIEREIELGGDVSVPLLLSIFDSNTPGHDGAVIIENGKIKYFGAHLPLAQKITESMRTGTRHRAATGLTEETDAFVIVVSEERGVVSLAQNGRIQQVSDEVLLSRLSNFIEKQAPQNNKDSHWLKYLVIKNWIEKLISIILAIILWVSFIFY